jgi:DNA-binding transcriptional MerR regulator
LAASIASIAPNQATTVQQIRHWTREGMLPPVEHLHSGAGKHREYDRASAPYEAAVLHLFNDLGLPISGSPILPDALEQVRREVAKRKSGKGKKNPHLIIAGGPPTGMTAVRIYGQGEKVRDAVVTIDIDLGKLFAQIESVR